MEPMGEWIKTVFAFLYSAADASVSVENVITHL